jgi:hypothetical protein
MMQHVQRTVSPDGTERWGDLRAIPSFDAAARSSELLPSGRLPYETALDLTDFITQTAAQTGQPEPAPQGQTGQPEPAPRDQQRQAPPASRDQATEPVPARSDNPTVENSLPAAEEPEHSLDLARIGWSITTIAFLIAMVVLALRGDIGYAGVTLAVAVAAAINLF